VEWVRDRFTVSSDPKRVDLALVSTFLASTYWAQGIPASTVQKSLDGSMCFSLLVGERQIGFARVITDRATIAYLADVFVLPEYRAQGLGTWLVDCVLKHPELEGLRRWVLVTKDAHELYRKFGFRPLARPEGFMEIHNPDAYRNAEQGSPK
jgi:GNAT superfamily N-acetyltransferase